MECTAEGLHSSGSFTMFSAPIRVFLFEVCWLSLIIPLVNFSVTSLCTALTHLAYQRVSCDEVFMLIWAEGWASATCQNLLDVMLIWTEGWASTSCWSLLDASQKARSLLPPPSTLVFYYFLQLRLWPGPIKPGWGIWEEIPMAISTGLCCSVCTHRCPMGNQLLLQPRRVTCPWISVVAWFLSLCDLQHSEWC